MVDVIREFTQADYSNQKDRIGAIVPDFIRFCSSRWGGWWGIYLDRE